MKPYYDEDGIQIFHGDCRDFFSQVESHWYDFAFADPPYGIDKADWDSTYPEGFERELIRIARCIAITPGQWALQKCLSNVGTAFAGLHSARNLNGMTFSPLGFGNWIPTVMAGEVIKGPDAFEFTVNGEMPEHPSPKPYQYMHKLLTRFTSKEDLVLDAFAGSGTTLVAAKNIGMHAVGIEIEEKYCEIAAKRLSQKVFQF